jgi:cell surface protein SprA
VVFHLGSLSEDLMRDGKHAFENGLPPDGNLDGGSATPNEWGYVTTQQYLNAAFNNEQASRQNQDVGLDGLSSEKENDYFKDFLSKVTPAALNIVKSDPSGDDFLSPFNASYGDAKLLERYKNYNGHEKNSPIFTTSEPAQGTTIPENEDLNQDNTLSDLEEYYAYNIDLRPGKLEVGNKYIVDKIVPTDPKFNGEVTWYLFRIPVRQFDEKVGDITGFKSIRYARMYLTGFSQPVVMRLANFRFVGNRWRRYTGNLEESKFGEVLEPNLDNFSVSTVNVEENGIGNNEKPAYVEPLRRDRDNTSVQQRRLNEQAVQLCVTDLPDGDARSIYKNVTMDFFNYGRIKMFLHAHGPNLSDNQLVAFLRLGTDFDQNYYEIEIPLKKTDPGLSRDAAVIWPEENYIDMDLNELYALKAQRDRENFSLGELYPREAPRLVGNQAIRVFGRPDLSQVKLMMIGVRNPRSDDAKPINVCMWANELRLTEFDRTAGWAANVVLNAKLADLGTVTGSLKHITFGYGGVQSKISERARGETTIYDVSSNLAIDKLLPKGLGLKIPMFFSYETTTLNPNFDPANPDLRLAAAFKSFNSDQERENYKKLIQDKSIRRSLNFTNVRKVKVKKDAVSHFFDVENFAFTYAFSEASQTNFNLIENTKRSIKGAVAWQYSPKFKGFEPFKDVKFLSSPFLQLIKDFNFNPLPTNVSIRGELDRSFSKLVYRNNVKDLAGSQPNFQKFFVFNRYYNAKWSLSKSLTLDYTSRMNAIIDEPNGDLDNEDSIKIVINNLKKFGRAKNFEQTITANYTLPLDKLPITNWLGADYRYNVGYSWKAGPLETTQTLKLGNIIQNTQEQALTGRVDFVKLYNKVKFLKDINTPKRKLTPIEKAKQAQAKPDTVKTPPDLFALKGIMRLIMSVRNISGNYNLSRGTILPGFTPSPYLFGNDKSWSAPGWDFILGGQDPNIRFKAAENGWMSTSPKLTAPFSQLETKDISVKASIEPSSDFKIQLDVKKTSNSTYQENFRFDEVSRGYESLSEYQTGSYKISTVAINTAFKNNTSTTSTVFQEFEKNIATIQNRFTDAAGSGYESKSQDVLIPAFIAAYSGKSAETVNLSPFPSIPIPNWRVDYSGLGKIGALKDVFQSVTLNHAYSSSYSVTNFSNSLEYENVGISVPLENYNNPVATNKIANAQGQLIPVYVISQVMISEQFAPLIGINVRTKNKMTLRLDYKTKRDVSLSTSNAQITELIGKDWSFEIGYTKNNLRLPIKDQGRVITLKNDITFRLNTSVTNNRTIQRRIDGDNNVTNGNINFQLRPNVSYVVNQKLSIQLYFERNVNDPLVSNSYRRATTRFGTKIQFNLAQ